MADNGLIRGGGGRFAGSEVAQGMFPFMCEEFGELDEMDRLFVTVCESVVKP